jgi:hypothetical protein
MKTLRCAFVILLAFALRQPCQAQLSSKDFIAAKQMVKGTFYLRIDLPCHYFHPSAGGFFMTSWSLASSIAGQVEPIVHGSACPLGLTGPPPEEVARRMAPR